LVARHEVGALPSILPANMWSLLKVAAAVAALALRVTAHDGINQLYESVSPASILDGEPKGKIVKIGALVSAWIFPQRTLIVSRWR